MRVLPLLAAVPLVAIPLIAPSASAKVVEKEKFHDEFTSDVYDCDGITAQDTGVVDGTLTVVQRGSSPFPYFNEHVRGTVVTTNLETGGTFTQIFSTHTSDQRIVDNGDGTITITVNASGGVRLYDQFGNFVLKDPGMFRFSFDIDYNGTPSNPDDDTDVPDSLVVLKPSTGNSDFSERDFCDDLATYTAAP